MRVLLFGFAQSTRAAFYPAILFRPPHPSGMPDWWPYMADPENELAAKVLRLQAERENLVYVLSNTELTDEHRTLLRKQLMSVQTELVMLTGGISVN